MSENERPSNEDARAPGGDDAARLYLADALRNFREYKALAEKALAQVSDEQFFAALDEGSNSLALTVKHVSGNLLSRWTSFLTSDGEKEWRDRDSEFEAEEDESRADYMARWERGWAQLFGAVEPLGPEDLLREVTIRGEAHKVLEAINRQLTHYAYHVGQIVFLAKHLRAGEWQTLSIPKGRSRRFNDSMRARAEGGAGAGRARLSPDASLYVDHEE